ncbi:FG-GAP-like repeat-containing protein [Dankookia sp. P2]|uniref:FG-GAP-like repeat-containing protein n=1 Tax=Dankookia sp. P2 TaxID=3423955 RepID=UPI003D66C7C1
MVWGKADSADVTLGDIDGASALGYRIRGFGFDGRAGSTLAAIGDQNGDGLVDMAIGAPGEERVYVVFGKTDAATVDLPDIAAGQGGYVIDGERAGGLGYGVSAMADMNGDGRPKLLVSAFGLDAAGAAYLVMSQAGTAAIDLAAIAAGNAGTSAGFKIIGENPYDQPGYRNIIGVPDLNGDGLPDILVGAAGNDQNGLNSGALYIVWGKLDGTPVLLSEVAQGHGGIKLMGEGQYAGLGGAVDWLPDLNGDGRPEILVGAEADINAGGLFAGAAYVVYSRPDWIGLG